ALTGAGPEPSLSESEIDQLGEGRRKLDDLIDALDKVRDRVALAFGDSFGALVGRATGALETNRERIADWLTQAGDAGEKVINDFFRIVDDPKLADDNSLSAAARSI